MWNVITEQSCGVRKAWYLAACVGVGVLGMQFGVGPIRAADGDGSAGDITAASEAYRLGAQDKIRINAFEWRASRDEVFEWKALNAEYIIGAGGLVSVPLIGQVKSTGLTTSELAKTIGERLRARLGLAEPPDVSIEVVSFRPFYIVGDIQKPGAYEFKPGLTLLQGVSLAGGLLRANDGDGMRVRRDLIVTRGELNVFDNEARSLMARKARLDAEMLDATAIEFPSELLEQRSDGSTMALMRQEEIFFQTRKRAFDSQILALEALKSFLEKEGVALEAQLKSHVRQSKLVEKELDGVADLYKRGLAIAPRKLGLERNVAQLDGARIRLESELARANQEVSKVAISIADLRNRRLSEASAELRLTQTRQEEIGQRTKTAIKLLREVSSSTPRLVLTSGQQQGSPAVKYIIVRRVDGRLIEIPADETTELQPADSVKVDSESQRSGGSVGEMYVDTLSESRLRPIPPLPRPASGTFRRTALTKVLPLSKRD